MTSFFLINYYQRWESYRNALVTLLTMRFGDLAIFLLLSCFYVYSYRGTVVCNLTQVRSF